MYEPKDDYIPVSTNELGDQLTRLEVSVDSLTDELKFLREDMARRLDVIENALDTIMKSLEKQDEKLETIEIFSVGRG